MTTIIQDIATAVTGQDSARSSILRPTMVIRTVGPITNVTGKNEPFELVFDVQPKDEIKITGSQNVAVFRNPGGKPSYQSVGPDTSFISWQGVLMGPAAFDNANNLVLVRDSGVEVYIMYGPIYKKGIIKYFNFSVKRFDLITYQVGVYIEQNLEDPTFYSSKRLSILSRIPIVGPLYRALYNTANKVTGKIGGYIRNTARGVFGVNNIIDGEIAAWGGLANIPAAGLKNLSSEIRSMNASLQGVKTSCYQDYTYRNYRGAIGQSTIPEAAGIFQ